MTGNSALLDTTIVVQHFRDPLAVTSQLNALEELYLPAPALAELYYGAFRSARPDAHVAKIHRFLAAVQILTPDEDTPEQYGRIAAQLAKDGKTIPQNDIWIAALGIQHGLPVWTLDKHFGYVRGIALFDSGKP